MSDDTLHVVTEDGEEFIADVESVETEVDIEGHGSGGIVKSSKYTFQVGVLINEETGEQY